MPAPTRKMQRPGRAMVLAAGLGTRFLPLSAELPKALLPLWNRPLLFRCLDLLRSWGVRAVVINLHHAAKEIESAVTAAGFHDLDLSFSREPIRLETGGALRRTANFFTLDPFWLINSDIAADVEPGPMVDALNADPSALAALWLTDRAGPRTVEASDGRIHSFRSSRAGSNGTYTFCGLHLVRPEVLDFIPNEERRSIIRVYEDAQRAGRTILGVVQSDSFWADLGSPEQALDAHAAVRAAYASNRPGRGLFDAQAAVAGTNGAWVCAAPDSRIEAGARVAESILLPGSIVRRGADIRRAVVGPGTQVRGPATRLLVRASRGLSGTEQALITRVGFRPERTSVEALSPRGSARAFYRLRDGGRHAMLMRWRKERPENARWAGHARFLDALGITVPDLHGEQVDAEGGILLIRDFGSRTLQDELNPTPTRRGLILLGRVIDRVVHLHEEGPDAARAAGLKTEPPFTHRLYRMEHRLFLDRVLHERMGLTEQTIRPAMRELDCVADALEREPDALIHRDLQSSNILRSGREPVFIDFQGLRPGPAVYDLASLVYDPYIDLQEADRERLVRAYRRASRRGAAAIRALPWGAVQRLTQAMGAYVRLGTDYGLSRFEMYLPVAAQRAAGVIRQANLPLPCLLEVLTRLAAKTCATPRGLR